VIFDVITFVVAFLLALGLYPLTIRALQRLKAGQVIQAELPESHQRKAGTPTGGGVVFAALGIAGGVLAAVAGHAGAMPSVAGLVAGAAIGFVDDRSKLRVGSRGVPARFKFPIEFVLALPVAALALAQGGMHQYFLPSSPWLLFPLAVLAIVATTNAVNITDGIDGLAGGLAAIALAALVLIGFALAAMAIQQGLLLLLPLVGLVFVLETLSVIIQVAYFKASGGRRVFKMTPIHYTFHHEGWSENRIALSFWGAGLLSALAAAGVARLIS
jgi:phospho-N-acetylmuramoyl-pentapeptide-transferase